MQNIYGEYLSFDWLIVIAFFIREQC